MGYSPHYGWTGHMKGERRDCVMAPTHIQVYVCIQIYIYICIPTYPHIMCVHAGDGSFLLFKPLGLTSVPSSPTSFVLLSSLGCGGIHRLVTRMCSLIDAMFCSSCCCLFPFVGHGFSLALSFPFLACFRVGCCFALFLSHACLRLISAMPRC